MPSTEVTAESVAKLTALVEEQASMLKIQKQMLDQLLENSNRQNIRIEELLNRVGAGMVR